MISRTRFYEDYHKAAEEHDRGFLKKHDEDLNTTLIFVSCERTFDELALTKGIGRFVLCRHLRIYHRGRPPAPTCPNDETAALLHVLHYKIDNKTFGNNVPALPNVPVLPNGPVLPARSSKLSPSHPLR